MTRGAQSTCRATAGPSGPRSAAHCPQLSFRGAFWNVEVTRGMATAVQRSPDLHGLGGAPCSRPRGATRWTPGPALRGANAARFAPLTARVSPPPRGCPGRAAAGKRRACLPAATQRHPTERIRSPSFSTFLGATDVCTELQRNTFLQSGRRRLHSMKRSLSVRGLGCPSSGTRHCAHGVRGRRHPRQACRPPAPGNAAGDVPDGARELRMGDSATLLGLPRSGPPAWDTLLGRTGPREGRAARKRRGGSHGGAVAASDAEGTRRRRLIGGRGTQSPRVRLCKALRLHCPEESPLVATHGSRGSRKKGPPSRPG